MQYLDAMSKTTVISVGFQGKPFNITVIQVYALTSNAEEAEVEQFNEDLQDSRTNTQKGCPFNYRGLGSQETPGNRQIWPWSTESSRAKANRVLSRECIPTTQEKTLHMDITRRPTQNQIDYILCSQRWKSSIQSAKNKTGS